MKRPDPQSGFSIMDIIMGLSIIAVAIVGMMLAQRNYVQQSSQVEVGLRAVSLGNSVMNIIRMHAYDDSTSSPWSPSLGPNTGESSADDYDDIDDYDGASWDFSNDGFAGFTINTRVFNVQIPTNWVDSVGTGGNFKKITVTVNHSVLKSPVTFSSIVAGIEEHD
ncbi:MAG: hypothetical protein U9Q77_05210 [Candidatus Marinimicrobia bacterium]|nr:hypothetical protein [Candidatus Neomarinimicrobiota bacterium]